VEYNLEECARRILFFTLTQKENLCPEDYKDGHSGMCVVANGDHATRENPIDKTHPRLQSLPLDYFITPNTRKEILCLDYLTL
jgi:hypothetical protein